MEPHLLTRPPKIPFPLAEQERLRVAALVAIKNLLLPNIGIFKIVLIGSSVKGSFGEYESPGFRGSLFSDFDFIVFVSDDYVISSALEREVSAKPFPDDALNLAYRIKKFVENKFDAEIFFIREQSLAISSFRETAEMVGIPLSVHSIHPNVIVYERSL